MKKIQLAFRSLLHYKQYSIINILGLALSLACVIIIFRYVHGEMTVDRFNRNLDRIFITTIEVREHPGLVQPIGVELLSRMGDFPDILQHSGVEKATHFSSWEHFSEAIEFGNHTFTPAITIVDSNFLRIFDFPIIAGVDRLTEPSTAMITAEFAQRAFGNENAIGKTFQYRNRLLTITGVIGQTSTKSSLTFDLLIPAYNMWGTQATAVLLHPMVDYRAINQQFGDFLEISDAIQEMALRLQLLPMSEVYLDNRLFRLQSPFEYGSRTNVTILMIVGFLILLVGVFNYINISTVVILRRGKELGIKKVFGAGGRGIFAQLLLDNVVQIMVAMFFAFIFLTIANPLVSNRLLLSQMPNIRFDVGLSIALLFSLSFIATLYPFYRYYFSTPITSLRNLDKIRGGGGLQRIMLLLQYIITIAMIIVSLFFVKQVHFMLNTDVGFRTENIIRASFQQNRLPSFSDADDWRRHQEDTQRAAAHLNLQMNSSPLFTHWTQGASPNQFPAIAFFPFNVDGGEYQSVSLMGSNEDWFNLFEFQAIAGRLWDDTIDTEEQYHIIVTESTLRLFGITDWESALLQPQRPLRHTFNPDNPNQVQPNPPYRIVGVVRDFHFVHLSQPSVPVVFTYQQPHSSMPVLASIVRGRTQDAIEFLRTLHEETVGGEFEFTFVEDEMRALYAEERKIATISSILTLIAILISALGLFGMSFFDIQKRRREIAIRKVNGATVSDIIRLLLKKYLISLGIAFVIAAPIAAYSINRYLEDFAHRASVAWWLFAVSQRTVLWLKKRTRQVCLSIVWQIIKIILPLHAVLRKSCPQSFSINEKA